MHPSLAPHLHNECLEIIEQLHRCHEEVSSSPFGVVMLYYITGEA